MKGASAPESWESSASLSSRALPSRVHGKSVLYGLQETMLVAPCQRNVYYSDECFQKSSKKINGHTTERNCLAFSWRQFSCRPIKWLGSGQVYYFNFPNAKEGGLKTHCLHSVLIKTICKAEFNMPSSPQTCWCHFLTTQYQNEKQM